MYVARIWLFGLLLDFGSPGKIPDLGVPSDQKTSILSLHEKVIFTKPADELITSLRVWIGNASDPILIEDGMSVPSIAVQEIPSFTLVPEGRVQSHKHFWIIMLGEDTKRAAGLQVPSASSSVFFAGRYQIPMSAEGDGPVLLRPDSEPVLEYVPPYASFPRQKDKLASRYVVSVAFAMEESISSNDASPAIRLGTDLMTTLEELRKLSIPTFTAVTFFVDCAGTPETNLDANPNVGTIRLQVRHGVELHSLPGENPSIKQWVPVSPHEQILGFGVAATLIGLVLYIVKM